MRLKNTLRAIIGTLVSGSALLGYFYDPSWLYFTMFIGFNMLQSAFTNWCFLEILLKKIGAKE